MNSTQDGFHEALDAMGRREDANCLVRIRWYAQNHASGVYERFVWAQALCSLARYSEALHLLRSHRTLGGIAECRRAWVASPEKRGEGLSAAAGMEEVRCDSLGDLYKRKGQWCTAIRWYEQALRWHKKELRWNPSRSERLKEHGAELHLTLGELLWKQGKWNQARRHVRYAARTHPDPEARQETRYALGLICRTEGLYNIAARYFKQVEATPELEDLQQAKAMPGHPKRDQLTTLTGPVAWAVGAPRYLRTHPEDWEVRLKLCCHLAQLYRFKEALNQVSAVERSHRAALPGIVVEKGGPLIALLASHRGDIYKQQGRYRSAGLWYSQAAEIEPDEPSHWTGQGICEANRGNLSKAEQLLRRATQFSTGSLAVAWYNLGLVLRSREYFREAAKSFSLSLTLDPNSEDARLALVDVKKAMDFLASVADVPPPVARAR